MCLPLSIHPLGLPLHFVGAGCLSIVGGHALHNAMNVSVTVSTEALEIIEPRFMPVAHFCNCRFVMMHLDAGLAILVPKHYYGVHFAAFAKEPTMLADEFRLLGSRQSMPAFAAEVGQESNVAFGPNLVPSREFLGWINDLYLRHDAAYALDNLVGAL